LEKKCIADLVSSCFPREKIIKNPVILLFSMPQPKMRKYREDTMAIHK
jgi:hypothetical protein